MEKQSLLRKIPKIEEMLQDERLIFFIETMPRKTVADVLRRIIDRERTYILSGERKEELSKQEVLEEAVSELSNPQKSLRKILNGTGIILHTNLGRAILSEQAIKAVCETASAYSNLEYRIEEGTRGSRHDHIEHLLCQITGAESAMVVNNNAAATMLCLSSVAKGKEVVVSRGELVEIGGSFRIPDIMKESGAVLAEVGTTNKTKPEDYRNAYDEERTAAFMKVHTSNYKIIGFTRETTLEELNDLKSTCPVPLIYDMGCGLLLDMSKYGLMEPNVKSALSMGADIVLFSGDKLLGGPQAGIIVGKKTYIDRMKKHPLARVLRVDKMTLAALEATLFEYEDRRFAEEHIPVLRMMTASQKLLKEKAEKLKRLVEQKLFADNTIEHCNSKKEIGERMYTLNLEECMDQIGGGTSPDFFLTGFALVIDLRENSDIQRFEQSLRAQELPLISRVYRDRIWVSVRTISEDEIEAASETIAAALLSLGE